MVQSLKVILWGEEIGRLAWDTRRRLSCFMYNPVFLKKGLNIFPLAAPVDGARGLTPVWGEEAKIYQKNPDEFYIPSDVTVVGVENGENFCRIRSQKYLFALILVTFFTCLYEIGIFGKTGGVEYDRFIVFIGNIPDFP